MSIGEKRISEYLNKNKIKYIYDFPYFDDLLSPRGNKLRPDFILPDYKIWIEFDGIFHYEQQYKGDGSEDIKIHDKIKDIYSQEHDWKLIRIPYWEIENIEKILKNNIC